MKVKIKRERDSNKAYTAKVTHRGGEEETHLIEFSLENIQKCLDQGYTFFGIKPENFSEALQLVLEHEVCHVISCHIDKYYGHGENFMKYARKYGHTDFKVRG